MTAAMAVAVAVAALCVAVFSLFNCLLAHSTEEAELAGMLSAACGVIAQAYRGNDLVVACGCGVGRWVSHGGCLWCTL